MMRKPAARLVPSKHPHPPPPPALNSTPLWTQILLAGALSIIIITTTTTILHKLNDHHNITRQLLLLLLLPVPLPTIFFFCFQSFTPGRLCQAAAVSSVGVWLRFAFAWLCFTPWPYLSFPPQFHCNSWHHHSLSLSPSLPHHAGSVNLTFVWKWTYVCVKCQVILRVTVWIDLADWLAKFPEICFSLSPTANRCTAERESGIDSLC